MPNLPKSLLETSALNSADAFEHWRDWISVVFDTERAVPVNGSGFGVRMATHLLGQIVMGNTICSEGLYSRSRAKVSRDGSDAIMIQYFIRGETQFGTGRDTTNVRAGDITIFDLAQPMANFNTAYHHYTIVVPRELLRAQGVDGAFWHGKRLPRESAFTRMLANHLRSLFEFSDSLTKDGVWGLQDATVNLAAAALRHPLGGAVSMNQLQFSLLNEIKRYIRANLATSGLDADGIARRFGMSRAKLYRLTECMGGVMNYVREQRLEAVRRELEDPRSDHLSITAVALKWGFDGHNAFTRNFKARYGVLPKEMRHHARFVAVLGLSPTGATAARPDSGGVGGFDDWMRSVASG